MQKKPSHPESDLIACEVCLKEIPRDVAKSDEATGYVHYFCGEACFVKWRQDTGKTDEAKPPKP